jgi:hypothetical protein
METAKKFHVHVLASAIVIIVIGVQAFYGRVPIVTDPNARVDIAEAETLLSGFGCWILEIDGVADASTRVLAILLPILA